MKGFDKLNNKVILNVIKVMLSFVDDFSRHVVIDKMKIDKFSG